MQISFRSLALTALISLIFGFSGAAMWSYSGLGDGQTRAYLLDNPDLLPEMAERYQQQQGVERMAGIEQRVQTPFPGAEFGNPEGSVTMVEFTDYACGYCRASQEHVAQLVRDNPDLRVVIREWPIFEGSDKAALVALAAAKQGRYRAFHDAMFTKGSPTDAAIAAAAKEAGLDMEQAGEFAVSAEARAELASNTDLAREIGFSGTPSWVIGGQPFEGAIGLEALQQAIDAARDR
ncbi:DsbA family protein [Allopontixanthobacter sp.]|uniref:DsbA family protein n=1 Tax=Allopontixanthobacter sp. TaxID=2906452 RepID=UPI002ABB6246|nr:DsbA family protein [Allopontixanthobacter sp.]MDZ4308647.1 DsbA family protein [Allopontixanthobacter sp.]